MKIAFIVSEAVPFAKTGGLADVAAALPAALAEAGNDVVILLPFYREIREKFPGLSRRLGPGTGMPAVYEYRGFPVPVWFLEHDGWFGRRHLYCTASGDDPDNGDRFAWFCRLALASLQRIGFRSDIVHLHDWQTALAAAYLKFVLDRESYFAGTKAVFTIHNLAYQGLFDPGILDRAGLPEPLFQMEDLEFFGRVSFLKAGILYADAITTVSPRYAREIQTPEFGCGLDGLLQARSSVLRGIVNGIDTAAWDPEKDPALVAPFGPENMAGKALCKRDMLRSFGFVKTADDPPVISMVSRLAGQKGLDLLVEAVEDLVSLGLRIIIVGEGEAHIERGLQAARSRFPGKIGLRIGFDDRLARKVFAGSDFILIPSRYEPCGLTQMYGQRYGTIPIVRAVGGLDDTVEEYRLETGEGTGFKFAEATPRALVAAVRRALNACRNPETRLAIRRKGMARDFSWKRSAEAYLGLYHGLRGG